MEVALSQPPHDSGVSGVSSSSQQRRVLVGVLLVVMVLACVGTVLTATFPDRFHGDGSSGEGSADTTSGPEAAEQRATLLGAAQTFVERFNTYGPEMLDDTGHLPDYAAIADLMTADFAEVFNKNVGYAEETVVQLGAERSVEVFGVAVASMDGDSAEVLVAGTVELSYPYPDEADQQTSDDPQQGDSEDDPRVTTGKKRFRYQVSLVKVGDEWLIDNLDDVDDQMPPFADPVTEPGTDAPSTSPTEPAPSESQSTEEDQ